MKSKAFIALFLLLFLMAFPPDLVAAQDSGSGPVYIIQPGDTLNVIAVRFGVTVDDLININNLENPNVLSAGQELVIPGLEGVQGKLITEAIPLGENLQSISRRYRIPEPMLVKLNRITSPMELYAGSNLIIPQDDRSGPLSGRTVLAPGETLLEAAAIHNANPWELVSSNQLDGSWDALPGSALYFTGKEPANDSSPIPLVSKMQLDTLPLVQGQTAVVRVTTLQPLQLTGSLNGQELHFFPVEQGKNDYIALQGVYALAKPGLAPFILKGMADNGQAFDFEQMVMIQAGGYAKDPPLSVDPATLEAANTRPEEDQVKQAVTPATPTRYWTDIFRTPVDEPVCIKSWYGNRRAYNGGDYIYFHTGVDYGVCANLNIYAPAPGVVVFAGPLTVRGNATIIDHGWGVYSGMYHQSEIKVKVGDRVEAGQMIGLVGGTGRVTGPHLHWDLFVNGVQVQPLDWLEKAYP